MMTGLRKTSKSLATVIAWASVVLLLFAACGDDETSATNQNEQQNQQQNENQQNTNQQNTNQQNTNQQNSEENACGGEQELTLGGEPAEPGDACGPCGDGEATCESADSLTCSGASETNGCGGCETLAGEPGTTCGEDGTWVCDGENAVHCEGSGEFNACGGEEELTYEGSPAMPGDSCGPCDDGELACQSEDALTCSDATELNDCGGCQSLANEPGETCGEDDEGIWQCDGENSIECNEEGSLLNACGGFDDLDEDPGEPCTVGGIDGVWQCDGPNDVICDEEPDTNACGGESTLAEEPGEDCAGGDGTWTCDGQEDVACECDASNQSFDGNECVDEPNACGGESELAHEPGDSCAGGDGTWECHGSNDVACACDDPTHYYDGNECVEQEEPNACGGDTVLSDEPGEDCADGDGTWECDGEENVVCDCGDPDEVYIEIGGEGMCETACSDDSDCSSGYRCATTLGICVEEASNACGGESTLAEEPGDDCAGGGGTWQCDGSEDVVCECDDAGQIYDGTQCIDGECIDDGDCANDEECDTATNECILDGEALCEAYCHLWYGCPADECGVSSLDPVVDACMTGTGVEYVGCVNDVDSDREFYEDFVYADFESEEDDPPLRDTPNQCEDVRFIHCGQMGFETECGCDTPTTLGDSCTTGDDTCDAGELFYAECYDFSSEDPEAPGQSGECYAGVCYVPGDFGGNQNRGGGCGPDNLCYQIEFEDGTLSGICLEDDLCTSNAECPTGEACQITGEFLYDNATWADSDPQPELARICFDECQVVEDCVVEGADTDGIRCSAEGTCEYACGTEDGGISESLCQASGGTCVDATDDPDVDEWCALD